MEKDAQKPNIDELKKKLEAEKAEIEKTLRGVGRVNPDNRDDWEPTPADLNIQQADNNEAADVMEEYEERSAVEVEVENRLDNIKKALARIEEGTYGICDVCGSAIENDRLEANPAATTCKAHLNG